VRRASFTRHGISATFKFVSPIPEKNKRRMSMTKRLAAFLSCLTLACAFAATATTTRASERERHPEIRKAINALERARGELRDAAHDFCGHRAEALEATDNALRQLRLALESDRAGLSSPKPAPSGFVFENATYAVPSFAERERHPEIREAMRALERAKNDLQHAAHDFHGHREEAVAAINRALNQLQLALACDRR
jgi:F0F1-type ATP synthase membrane subunit b/b'